MGNVLTHRANVRRPPVMSIAAHIAGAPLVAMRQTVAAVILIASDAANVVREKHQLQSVMFCFKGQDVAPGHSQYRYAVASGAPRK